MDALYREVFERSPVAMLLVGVSGQIRLANARVEQLFGYTSTELGGLDVTSLVPSALKALPSTPESPQPRRMGKAHDLTGHHNDGGCFPVEVALSPVDVDGEPAVLVSLVDISERRNAEERFRTAVEAAPNGMLMIDTDHKIVLCNRQIEQIFGYAKGELLGAPLASLVPIEFAGEHPRLVNAFLEAPTARNMGVGRELHGRHKTGRMVPVEVGLRPMQSGGETYVISSVVDITSRRLAEAELRSKTEELEEFAYRTSHDLRSPIKSIASMAECIAEDIESKDYDEAKSGLDRVSRHAHRLLNLIEDILTLTQVGSASNDYATFDFSDYRQSTKATFHSELAATGVELTFQLEHLQPLITQPTRLTQILDNLIGNGIKYCDASKPQRHVRVHTSSSAERFVIRVEDNGTGIPSNCHGDVFGMFKRFHSSSIPGSGLGLYIASKQAQKLNAKIRFESDEHGTTFTLELPTEVATQLSVS